MFHDQDSIEVAKCINFNFTTSFQIDSHIQPNEKEEIYDFIK